MENWTKLKNEQKLKKSTKNCSAKLTNGKIQFFKNKLPMSFINDHVLPIEFLENGFFTKQHFVGGHNDIPTSGHHCIPNEFVSRFLIAN